MNELKEQPKQTPIEIELQIDENGETTTRKLYGFLGLNPGNYSRWIKSNITENEFAEIGVDFHSSSMTSEGRGNFAEDFKLTAAFAKKLAMTAKNEKGEQARDYFIKVEDKLKETAINTSSLPPEMQMFKSIFDQQAKQYIEMQKIKEDTQKVSEKVESIRDIVAISSIDWRDETGELIRRMGVNQGGGQAFPQIRKESYEALEKRMGVSLQTRLTNKRRRMADEGVCKSKRDKLSNLDIIGEDKKLIEGYVAIVKEMAIKYGE